ncbi:hypothetical protein PM082_011594 [Marasmius tenuissimus]|nr:hypothetical protein PM082_011594 [Marasmius tenuissimus]
MVYESVLQLKSDIDNAIFEIAEKWNGDVPFDKIERGCRTSYGAFAGKKEAFALVGTKYRYCKDDDCTHYLVKQLVGAERMPELELNSVRLLQAIYDLLPGRLYNEKEPARESDVEDAVSILREVVVRTLVAFLEREETGSFSIPNLSFATPVLLSPPPSPQLPVASTPTPSPPLLPSLFSPSSPPPSTQPKNITEWLNQPTQPRASSAQQSSSSTAESSPFRRLAPSSKTSVGSVRSSPTTTSASAGAKRKRDEEAGVQDTPPRGGKKMKYFVDLTGDEYDADGEEDESVSDKKGKKPLRYAGPGTKARYTLADYEDEFDVLPSSDPEENDENEAPAYLRRRV